MSNVAREMITFLNNRLSYQVKRLDKAMISGNVKRQENAKSLIIQLNNDIKSWEVR